MGVLAEVSTTVEDLSMAVEAAQPWCLVRIRHLICLLDLNPLVLDHCFGLIPAV
jgi:hypothetical protein